LRAPELDAGDAFERFVEKLGLPLSLGSVGVDATQFPLIASVAAQHRFVQINPRPMRSEQDVIELLNMAA
jgi:maleylacetate reductase